MMASTELDKDYTYTPLDSRPGAFRLLRLSKGTDQWLDVDLIHTTLEEQDGCYEAVSYTWGDPAVQDDIYINRNELIGITYNLSLILRDLRLPDQDRLLWIDAICINQADLDEQGQQVQQMGDIYRSARAVLFCIGRPTELTDFLLDMLNMFLSEVSQDEPGREQCEAFADYIDSPEGPLRSSWKRFTELHWFDHHMFRHRLLLAFQQLISETWFRRVWVVQEVYNARQGFAYCGTRSVPAAVLAICGDFILSLDDESVPPAARALLQIMSRPKEEQLGFSAQGRGLRELITKFRKCQATNEYDRIYGLLSMATNPSAESSLRSSYTISTDQVILNTIRHICNSKEEFTISSPYRDIEEFIDDMREPERSKLLLWAVTGGYESVARYMLENGARPTIDNRVFDSSQMPIICKAAEKGHINIIRMLLETGRVHPDQGDGENMSPLFWAAGRGHEAIVEFLLGTGEVSMTREHKHTPTALHLAASSGNTAILKLLLDTSPKDIDRANDKGSTPLCFAAQAGHETAVNLLLNTGLVNIDVKGSGNRTPLFLAAARGHEAVVRSLLATKRVSFDVRDVDGSTPLLAAAAGGHYAVVRLLLDTGQVNIDARDKNNSSPLSLAAGRGYVTVTKMLLDSGQVQVNVQNGRSHFGGYEYGQTPLSVAAEAGYDDVVRLLLQQEDIDVNLADLKHEGTPLMYAAEHGRIAVVKLLLASPRVDVNAVDKKGRTPLYKAVYEGCSAGISAPEADCVAVAELLLGAQGIDLHLCHRLRGETLLHLAVKWREKVACLKLLLETGQFDVNARDIYGRTPLIYAAISHSPRHVEMLLATGQVDVNATQWDNTQWDENEILRVERITDPSLDADRFTFQGSTALCAGAQYAVGGAHLILGANGIEPDTHGINGMTPLCEAMKNRYREGIKMVQALLASGKVNVNLRDKREGATPLYYAAKYGNFYAARLLLATNEVDVHIPADDGKTPIVRAAQEGHFDIVDLIRSKLASAD